jgi:hypothetical protein
VIERVITVHALHCAATMAVLFVAFSLTDYISDTSYFCVGRDSSGFGLDVRGSIPGRGKKLFSSPQRLDRLPGPPSNLSHGNRVASSVAVQISGNVNEFSKLGSLELITFSLQLISSFTFARKLALSWLKESGGPQCCEMPRLSHFLDNQLIDGGAVVSRTRRTPCLGLSRIHGHSSAGRVG